VEDLFTLQKAKPRRILRLLDVKPRRFPTEDVLTAETNGEKDVIAKEERFQGQSKRVLISEFSNDDVFYAEEEEVNEGSFFNFGIRVLILEFSNDDVFYVDSNPYVLCLTR
ncbi:hypothetical protein HID58_021864, partial [Brassica napus]